MKNEQLYNQLSNALASEFHENWRQARKQPGDSFEPRWKNLNIKTDSDFIAKHLQCLNDSGKFPNYFKIDNETQKYLIDIANASYAELSPSWQAENKAAAEVIASMLCDGLGKNKKMGVLKMASVVHDEWLKRNTWAKGGELDVPFNKLSEPEQQKDIDQVEIGIALYNEIIESKAVTEEAKPSAQKLNI